MDLKIDTNALLQKARMDGLKEAAGKNNTDALRKKCQEFEAVFIQSLFKEMRSTVPDGGLFPKGTKENVFQDFMDMHVARDAARKNGLGIADALFTQLQESHKQK